MRKRDLQKSVAGFCATLALAFVSALLAPPVWAQRQNGIPTGCEAAEPDTPAYAKCLDNYNAAVLLQPSFASYYSRGRFYYEQGLTEQAVQDFSKAIILHEKSGAGSQADYVSACFFRGMAWRHENHNDEALADLTKVISLQPNFDEAYENRGNVYLGMGRYDLAIADFTRLISLRHDYSAYFDRGNAYEGGGQHDEAITDFTKVISLVPTFAYGYSSRGMAREQKGLRDQAIADYQAALAHDPNLQAAQDGLKRLSPTP